MSADDTSRSASMEQRLKRLEDLDAIRQLFFDYGHHLDRGDVDSYASLFAEEGELLLGPLGRAKGPEEIREMMTAVVAGSAGQSYHLIANPIIRLEDGADDATSEVTWAVIARGNEGTPQLTMLGRHVDRLVRENGEWRFLRREGHIDLPSKFTAQD